MPRPPFPRRRSLILGAALGMTSLLALTACSAPSPPTTATAFSDWSAVASDAEGQSVDLWMWGGDEQGNNYVDTVLAPAAAAEGVTLRRVPIADTADALNRVLTELQAGRSDDGSVDLIWVNGDNFLTGSQAGAWLCEWTPLLPNMAKVSASDPLLTEDFGAPVNGCEAPWNKAQFTFAYDSDAVDDPPSTMAELLEWIDANPGRFTYPAPPDFTGSAFLRQVLYSTAGGHDEVASEYSDETFNTLSPALYAALEEIAPSLWRGGDTYPADSEQLNSLYADGEVDFTMTYGPATLTKLVADGTYPAGTKVLTLEEGTLGNASFLAIPANAADAAGAMVVANLALSVDQQVAKADPATWGQFTVLDYDALTDDERGEFDSLPASPVVPSFEELSVSANPELEADWVRAIDEGWRTQVAASR
ncbi:ABC transporter substrate-binding protein [Microbacterium sp. R86528]|uniref:ABC transporter substrate-binding protein n=1 Tax=Microbacterium sp. R86528 TaxID=3093864 RepID=UPI0037CB5ED1